jgi:DNA-binding response OmpR family regulator
MLPPRDETRILCADSSAERLGRLMQRFRDEGFDVACTRSAADCLTAAAEFRPRVIVLDSEFLKVDLENIPEYINLVSAASSVFVTVGDLSEWSDKSPQHVDAVVKRDDLDSLVSLVHRFC